MMRRRDFLAAGAAAVAAPLRGAEPDRARWAELALGLARRAGATYADIRVNRYRSQRISTRELQVRNRRLSKLLLFCLRECNALAQGPAQTGRRLDQCDGM